MTYQQLNGSSIELDFLVFHTANPHVYEHFKNYALKWINRPGKKTTKISSKQIIGRIRWFVEVEVETELTEFKINDAFTAHYARLFIKDFPQHRDLFEVRKLRTEKPQEEPILI